MVPKKIKALQQTRGSVLTLIFVGVLLLAGLSYTVTQLGRVGSGGIEREQAEIDQAVLENYQSLIKAAQDRLTLINRCGSIDYTRPELQTPGGDKTCHLFHPSGGNVPYRDLMDSCELEGGSLSALSEGESCGDYIYVGEFSGNRIYTTLVDQGSIPWSTIKTTTDISSDTDGMTNTNDLLELNDTTYQAAEACRALGEDWYLPSKNELEFVHDNRNLGALSGTFDPAVYWSSTERDFDRAWRHDFDDDHQAGINKLTAYNVRCIRSD